MVRSQTEKKKNGARVEQLIAKNRFGNNKLVLSGFYVQRN
jgi:hypothetical protein